MRPSPAARSRRKARVLALAVCNHVRLKTKMKRQKGFRVKNCKEEFNRNGKVNCLVSFQYEATSNLGRTRVAFNRRAMPTPSQNYNRCRFYLNFKKAAKEY
ncbi:hypothetical protein CR513_02935, partial [Mucuna pruriens]